MTTFVLWHSKSKSWFRSSQNRDDVKDSQKQVARAGGAGAGDGNSTNSNTSKRSKFTRVSQLGVTGRSVVFKARSRAERDHWVLGISNEIERLVAKGAGDGEHVRLVESREGGGERVEEEDEEEDED